MTEKIYEKIDVKIDKKILESIEAWRKIRGNEESVEEAINRLIYRGLESTNEE